MPIKLISIHMPKTAGLSFAASLDCAYGASLLLDYYDVPINTPALKRNMRAMRDCLINSVRRFKRINCIHGHFLPLKYLSLAIRPNLLYVTWLRDPVERLASHYYFWQRKYDPATAPALQRRMMQEQWSLERFCLGPELRNFYHQFLWGFPISQLDFVGITEHYEEDLQYLSYNLLGVDLSLHRVNTNESMQEKPSYFSDTDLKQRIEAYHWRDVNLYRQALKKRADRS
jgi:hypothetical protein